MKYLAVLGRQPEISIAELEALLGGSCRTLPSPMLHSLRGGVPSGPSPAYAMFSSESRIDINRLGGIIKLAVKLESMPMEYLQDLPEGKLTVGVSDYSKNASRQTAQKEALKLKRILIKQGRSVRVVENKDAALSTATSLHNALNGNNPRKVEFIKIDQDWYRVVGVQNIDAYAKRDQGRPARDAKVGMLPPKLAQILINLCGSLKPGSRILDPFCGTGVVLQEALLMGYQAYGTDIDERMVEYTNKNLKWLMRRDTMHLLGGSCRTFSSPISLLLDGGPPPGASPAHVTHEESVSNNNVFRETLFQVFSGDATSFKWEQPIDAVACEGYLGKPFSKIPTDMELKKQKQECGAIILGFLKNLAGQIRENTPVTIAIPAWLRTNGEYERLDILDQIENLGYNVNNKSLEGLLYHRKDQIVARDIIILRKK